MRLPRDIDGEKLARCLKALGYRITRQRGSHMRLTTQTGGKHHEVIPKHKPLKPGTLDGILKSIACHHGMKRDELLKYLDL
ncbi:type II toxin-antitoxin system HicA family toxin [Puniceicoccales bacterium CK1056]|uniref:Type II toxin-antitoxin system HicA family toxin n=1 Tax=Oceanipulchritudo coccoides TaxID=2706888 RepID=A0A6B2M401_9BACT|nr:type II toxin-antitoxin system HicA family toxin [Oceanipulchritudo coccoides]